MMLARNAEAALENVPEHAQTHVNIFTAGRLLLL
jgi:hypothetical protein